MFLILCVDAKNPEKSDLMRVFTLEGQGEAFIYSSRKEAEERVDEDKQEYPDMYKYHIIPI
jgi:hypothetical protein